MRTLIAVLLSGLILVGGSLVRADRAPPPPSYYPLKVGSKWHYKMEVNNQTLTAVNEIAKVENIDGQMLARLECAINGKVAATEHLSNTAKGIFRHRFNGIEITPPVKLLSFPLKDGDTWKDAVKMGTEKATYECKVGKEDVEVPAGKYSAYTTSLELQAGGATVTTTYWFAANVGVVKQVADINGTKITLLLEKYEAGK